MSMRLTDQLFSQFAATPAPRAKKAKQREHLEKMAPIILEACYHGDDIAYRSLANVMGFERTNIIGTILGPGVAGRGGPKLWCRSGMVLACQENCALLAPFLTAEGETKLLSQLGVTLDELMAALQKLPKLSVDDLETEATQQVESIERFLDRDELDEDFANDWEGSPGL